MTTTATIPTTALQLRSLVQPDGKVIIGGSFTTVGGLTRSYLARLNTDGSVDASYAPAAPNGRVLSIARQADGKLIIAGTFTLIGTTGRSYLARLNTDGSLDTTFGSGGKLTVSLLGDLLYRITGVWPAAAASMCVLSLSCLSGL